MSRSLFAIDATSLLANANRYYNSIRDASKPHHGVSGFKNPNPSFVLPTAADLLKWRSERRSQPKVKHAPKQIPWQRVDNQLIAEINAKQCNAVTWLGHVAIWVQTTGKNLLIDPVFSDYAMPFQRFGAKRFTASPITVEQLPTIDAVLITHNHYDHLDTQSIVALEQKYAPNYYVPLGLAPWFAQLGIASERLIELDWWDSASLGEVEVHFTPAQHWSKRGAFDTNKSLWGGFYICSPSLSFYFTGDTGWSDSMRDTLLQIKNQLGSPDIAALPIGAYEPRWFMRMQHANPQDAVEMHQTLQPKRSFGVHWGTFVLTQEPIQQPPIDLAIALDKLGVSPAEFANLAIGETWQKG